MRTLCSHRSFACLVAVMAAMALAIAAPIAAAQTTQGGYAPPSSNVQAEIEDAPTSAPSGDPITRTGADAQASTAANTVKRSSSPANGALPFTGLDLGFIGLAGVGLLAVGFVLRRLTLRDGGAEQRNAA